MRVYYLKANGYANVEDVSPKAWIVEEPDGFHPLTNDCIFRAGIGAGEEEPVVFIWQNRTSPEGQDPERARATLKQVNRMKDHRQPVPVSRRWQRIARQVILRLAPIAGIIVILYGAHNGGLI